MRQHHANLAQRARGDEPILAGQRYANSAKFAKTNFTFGNESAAPATTYSLDFNTGPMPQWPPVAFQSASAAGSDVKAARKAARRERKAVIQRTNVVFGTDGVGRETAYQDFTATTPRGGVQAASCPPPQDAQILPPLGDVPSPLATRSTLQEDYMSYCPTIHHAIYGQRVATLEKVKEVNTCDSVGASLTGNRKRRMLTRSMVDYRHPVDVHRGNLSLLKNRIIPVSISNRDSVWDSVRNIDGPCRSTESRDNFSWPLGSERNAGKIFYRGCANRNR